MNSALFSYLSPNLLPILTPNNDIPNVIIPIIPTEIHKFVLKNANVIPTASASILVAIANTIITFIRIFIKRFFYHF